MKSNRPIVFLVLALWTASLACNLPGATPTPGETESPAPIQPAGAGGLSGAVWHDLCAVPDGALPNPLPTGCVPTGNGSAMANGNREADEPGIAGVTVDLHAGTCETPALTSATTDANGLYAFANLADGEYCVGVDLANEANQKILIPGGWSHPTTLTSLVYLSDTIQNNETITGLNFGWDYQFLPEIGATVPTATNTPLPVSGSSPSNSGAPTFTVDTAANCRFGPSTAYSIITSYPVGTTLTIIGRNSNSSWWLIQVSASQSCWISGVTGHTSGDTSSVPVVAGPPLPPTATPTPTSVPAPSGDNSPPILSGPVAVYTDIYYPTANCAANIFQVAIRAQDDNLNEVYLRYRVLGSGGYVGSWNTLTPNDNASGGLYGFNYDLNAQFAGELGGDNGTVQYQFFAKDTAGNTASYPDGSVLGVSLTYCP